MKKKPKAQKYTGVLDGFFETGCEGVMWILDTKPRSRKWDPDALIFIKPGDHLKVWGEDSSTLFEGEIIPDFKIGWTRYKKWSRHGQQLALGYWIHWVQKGWKPDDWATLFLKHKEWAMTAEQLTQWKNCKKLRAELISKFRPR